MSHTTNTKRPTREQPDRGTKRACMRVGFHLHGDAYTRVVTHDWQDGRVVSHTTTPGWRGFTPQPLSFIGCESSAPLALSPSVSSGGESSDSLSLSPSGGSGYELCVPQAPLHEFEGCRDLPMPPAPPIYPEIMECLGVSRLPPFRHPSARR